MMKASRAALSQWALAENRRKIRLQSTLELKSEDDHAESASSGEKEEENEMANQLNNFFAMKYSKTSSEKQPQKQMEVEMEMKMETETETKTETKKKTASESAGPMRLSNAPSRFEPGTYVEVAPVTKTRNWKTVGGGKVHASATKKAYNEKTPKFSYTMWKKKKYKSMKATEDKLRDVVRADIALERMKRKQRDEMREQNILKGAMVKPIRNMYKLKKLSKKQWETVVKASVAMKVAKNQVRNSFLERPDFHVGH